MSRTWIAVAAGLVLALVAFVSRVDRAPAAPVEGAAESPPAFRAIGVMVNAPTTESKQGGMEDLAFYGTFSRTRLAFELFFPEGGLIDLKREASALSAFSDDRGTDLLGQEELFGPFEMMPRISEDGRRMVFVVGSKVLPDPRATRLHATGEVAVLVADQVASHETRGVRLQQGSTFQVGPYSFRVERAGPSEWSDGWSVTLHTERDPAAVLRWAVRTGGEAEVELNESMTMSGAGSWQKTLECDAPMHGELTFLLEFWEDPRVVSIPLDAEVGLGLR